MKATLVKIGGKVYPVKYGYAALRAFSDVTGSNLADLDNLEDEMTMTQAIGMVWAGLKDGARVTKEPFTMDLDDVADLLDEDEGALLKVLKVFSGSLPTAETPAKKKRAKKK